LVEDQINAGLKPYNSWQPASGKRLLVKLQVGLQIWVGTAANNFRHRGVSINTGTVFVILVVRVIC
jgi:hypothetical protein